MYLRGTIHCIMDTGYVQVHINGMVGAEKLSPENYDINDLKTLLEEVILLFESTNTKNRPIVSLEIGEGSVIGRFKTTLQVVAIVGAVISLVQESNSLDGLDSRTANVFESIQKTARQKNYTFELSTSLSKEGEGLIITPQTKLIAHDPVLLEAEFYFYGTVVDAGGKSKPNIHLDVADLGVITISSPRDYLASLETNLLYHECGVRVRGMQNILTGEIGNTFELIELMDYSPAFDEEYLNECIHRASKHLKNIDPELYLDEIRGGYEHV